MNTFTYDAYGTLIASNSWPQTVYLYCGEQFARDLGFVYLRARYLNPNSGTFYSPDSFKGDPESPLSLHKYVYGQGDPINNRDPSGHQVVEVLVLIGVAAIIATVTTGCSSGCACGTPTVMFGRDRSRKEFSWHWIRVTNGVYDFGETMHVKWTYRGSVNKCKFNQLEGGVVVFKDRNGRASVKPGAWGPRYDIAQPNYPGGEYKDEIGGGAWQPGKDNGDWAAFVTESLWITLQCQSSDLTTKEHKVNVPPPPNPGLFPPK